MGLLWHVNKHGTTSWRLFPKRHLLFPKTFYFNWPEQPGTSQQRLGTSLAAGGWSVLRTQSDAIVWFRGRAWGICRAIGKPTARLVQQLENGHFKNVVASLTHVQLQLQGGRNQGCIKCCGGKLLQPATRTEQETIETTPAESHTSISHVYFLGTFLAVRRLSPCLMI